MRTAVSKKSVAKGSGAKTSTRPPRGKKKTSSARPKSVAGKRVQAAASGDGAGSASVLIDGRIRELGDWRGKALQKLREIIRSADPEIVEEWKWQTPVWSCGGIICTGESYKSHVKLTFAKGASLADPSQLFNSSLEGNVRRAVDIHEGEDVDAKALTALVRDAIAFNIMRKGS